jgi:hypothetical protein
VQEIGLPFLMVFQGERLYVDAHITKKSNPELRAAGWELGIHNWLEEPEEEEPEEIQP